MQRIKLGRGPGPNVEPQLILSLQSWWSLAAAFVYDDMHRGAQQGLWYLVLTGVQSQTARVADF